MIDTHVYTLKAEFASEKTDDRGRAQFEWRLIYAQIQRGGFQYTQNRKSAFRGNFPDTIPKCMPIHMTDGDENIVKLEEKVRKDKDAPKVLFIKEDEENAKDFADVVAILDEISKSDKREIGRCMVINVHTGRDVSALSRDKENSDYTGIVNILVLLLVLSNIKNIMKTFNERGWMLGAQIYEAVTKIDRFEPQYAWYAI